ncbi:hypothetical protein [Litorimonas sp.]|uniref:hypothetical protein n=1 Tax=Litorimonas sp. TaxID=1892381 RepID=UPI003A87BE44
MAKPKGKTPSFMSMSTGKPSRHICGKTTACTRCKEPIPKGGHCFKIPKLRNGFTAKPVHCDKCVALIVEQTKSDLATVENQLNN